MDACSIEALLARAHTLAGRTLGELAPAVRARGKGAVGELVERALGVARSSRPEPDLPALGVEIKTLPIGHGRLTESTFVCSAAPASLARETWHRSRARAKLACVLLVPVDVSAPTLLERRVGTAMLWSPDDEEEATLRADWEDLADLVARGLSSSISARRGRALQLRPKARDGAERRRVVGPDGDLWLVRPQGFYLRRAFMQRMLELRYARS